MGELITVSLAGCPLGVWVLMKRSHRITQPLPNASAPVLSAWLCLCAVGCSDPRPAVQSPDREVTQPARTAVKSTDEGAPPQPSAEPRQSPEVAVEPPDRRPVMPPSGRPAAAEKIDQERVAAFGIRRLQSLHLTLYTDLPPGGVIGELPEVFDQAIPQWCDYFQRDPAELTGWKLTGYVMQTPRRFRDAGLLPADVGPFLHGYNRGLEFWIHEQPTDYYRRHLMLHEGTHAFMQTQLGGAGPPWFMEGVAELLATHAWDGQRLTMRKMPTDRQQTPGWGRIRVIRDRVDAEQPLSLQQIFRYGPGAHRGVEPYAWSWAAATFFDQHPRWQAAFRALHRRVRGPATEFSERFMQQLRSDWTEITEEWQLFTHRMDYGYDVPRSAVVRRATRVVPDGGAEMQLETDRGWQASGWRLAADVTYLLTARGRYQLDDQPRIWWCEPEGVTIHYHRGRPLGMLLAAVSGQTPRAGDAVAPWLKPISVGRTRHVTLREAGTLYLAINEPSRGLSDNIGAITVRIQRQDVVHSQNGSSNAIDGSTGRREPPADVVRQR
ncbi:MAG: hypothetical protein CMJ59_17440 [Planctomycetaceae bacterium]|nr:hypothetical protein [Planctomycetaceae bacterium]